MAGPRVYDYRFKYHPADVCEYPRIHVDYEITDMDVSTTTKYYGFVSTFGSWIIMRWDTTTNQFRYSAGASAYTTAWTGKAGLTYTYFNLALGL